MVKIAVVDDEKAFRQILRMAVRSVFSEMEEECRITEFEDGSGFLETIKGGEKFDILFTDIQMQGVDGMELGRRVRRFCPEIYIVFITSFEEYAAESYRIEAYQYILKQDLDSRLPGILREIVGRICADEKEFRIVRNGTETVKIYYRDIIYLYKSKGAKYVNYVTEDGIYRERISLEEALKELDSRIFIPAGRGYVVNMRRILKIRQNVLYMEKGYEVQVSQAKLSEVKQQISRCWREI